MFVVRVVVGDGCGGGFCLLVVTKTVWFTLLCVDSVWYYMSDRFGLGLCSIVSISKQVR